MYRIEITENMLLNACKRARPKVKGILRWRVSDVEDVLQTACMKALEHADDFSGLSQFSTWFYMIAKNEALMLLRAANRRTICELPPDLIANKPNPEDIFFMKSRNQQMVDAILQLSPKLRAECLLWPTGENSDSKLQVGKMRRYYARKKLAEMGVIW